MCLENTGKIDKMTSKTQVSVVELALFVAIVLMPNFVSCGTMISTGHVRPGHHHHHGNSGKKSEPALAEHRHHHHGNRKTEGRDPRLQLCSGDVCDTRFHECADSCWCIPVTLYSGLCAGFCC